MNESEATYDKEIEYYPPFEHPGYDIQPGNMEKRVRVFINQLLPGIVRGVLTQNDLRFAYDVLGRHTHRFIPKLIEADMPDEMLMVLIAVSETVTKLLIKEREMMKREQTETRPGESN